jgi:hypothetical protein
LANTDNVGVDVPAGVCVLDDALCDPFGFGVARGDGDTSIGEDVFWSGDYLRRD